VIGFLDAYPAPWHAPPRLWSSAWPLLVLTNLLWAGNIVLARGVAGVVPPVALAYWRWTGAFLIALPFAWKLLRRDAGEMVRHWPIMLLLSGTGIAFYNTVSYIALNRTTALNVLLLQSATPLLIVALAFVIFRERPSARQTGGIVLSLCGVAAIAGHGSPAALAALRINPGDLWVTGALAVYAVYCVMLRRRPEVHPLSLLTALMGLGSLMMLPFYVWEHVAGAHIQAGWTAWTSMAYMAVFPSLIAYMLFNRGIELIGAGAAGHSMHLMPLFGSVLAVLFLHERFQPYHAAGIGLIGGGILLASVRLTRRAVPQDVRAGTCAR
jgi:drug/metabolite transporter (DMT)-like permease